MSGRGLGVLAALGLSLAIAGVWAFAAGGPRPAGASAAPAGADLFLAKGCAGCHVGPDGRGGGSGPSLRRLAADEEYVARAIRDPAADRAPGFARSGYGIDMPRLGLSAAEIDILVAYLLEGEVSG